ncbi:MAG: 4Fe-4S binding protein [Chitinivibrionales bacterium]|nr:4Fe-4S binding protein [Chitinivibrionales bacterium]
MSFTRRRFLTYISTFPLIGGALIASDVAASTVKYQINSRCVGCGACPGACSVRAIVRSGSRYTIDQKKCNGCAACVRTCRYGAIVKVATDITNHQNALPNTGLSNVSLSKTGASVVISFSTQKETTLSARVYSVSGRTVKQLYKQTLFNSGNHQVRWDTASMPKAMYYIEIVANGVVQIYPISI